MPQPYRIYIPLVVLGAGNRNVPVLGVDSVLVLAYAPNSV